VTGLQSCGRIHPQISVGIPVYNNERYVEQCLRSTCAQTCDDFEVVISDNACTDRTGEVCQDYAARDRRIRYFRNDANIGAVRNFNRVFQLCRGKYHKWLPADDFVDATLLEKARDVLDKDSEVVLCYPKTTLINENGGMLSRYEDNLDLRDPSPSRRFIQLLDTIGLCNAHLGLIRREILSRTALLGSQLGSDVHLLAELSL
jgi:glycosyltransferase involved in cell wall biosynthesis